MNFKGEGVPQDDAKAVHFFRKAAEQGDEEGLYQLGVMYAKGRGVKQSDIEAYAWWVAAAFNGSTNAANAFTTLATYMSQRDIAKAKKLAKKYWIKYALK
jgi:hypothetical protein